MTTTCGACDERTARVFIKGLPALCVRCARNVTVPLKQAPLDYVTANGFANARRVLSETPKETSRVREREAQSQLLLNLRFT